MDNYSTAFSDYDEYLLTLKTLELFRIKQYSLARKDFIGSNTPKHNDISDILAKKIECSFDDKYFEDISYMEDIFKERLNLSKDIIKTFPLEKLVISYNLSDFGRSILLFVLQSVVDNDFRNILKLLQNNSEFNNPTLEFCGKIFFLSENSLESNSEIYRKSMLEVKKLKYIFPSFKDTTSAFSSPLIPDDRLISLLCGDLETFPNYMELFDYNTNLEPNYFREEQLNTLINIYNLRKNLHCLIIGEKGIGKKHLIKHFSKATNCNALFIDCNYFSSFKTNEIYDVLEDTFIISLRESIFNDIPVIFYGLDFLSEDDIKNVFSSIFKLSTNSTSKVFILTEKEDLITLNENWFNLSLNDFDEKQRNIIWDLYKGDSVFADNVSITATANTFNLTAGQIKSAIAMANLLSSGKSEISKDCLYKACYTQTNHCLSKKSKKVKIGFTWDDLKLPPKDKETLRDICNRVKNKHIVLNNWGFSKLLPYGGGISTVFAGPPGTGKTMAAQVLAGELGMELYQIDLSQIVDKYVGETEKNIRIIFEEAKKSNSILFFDEADSLFSKRIQSSSGGGNSNDRYANMESSLLLQCVEAYNGISILATNHYDSIDPAFIRRFKYLINFRLPTPEIRLELWKSMFPQNAPLSNDVDLKFYADKFELSGAYIKNIALYAAFLAAEDKCEISDIHILKGLSKEMLKEGLKLDSSQLDNLCYLFNDI